MTIESRDAQAPLDAPLAVEIGAQPLQGLFGASPNASAIVIFAGGGSRVSPRNTFVSDHLRRNGFATLLLDLLTPQEERAGANAFDIALLAQRVAFATEWVGADARTRALRIGYFCANTGSAAALAAA